MPLTNVEICKRVTGATWRMVIPDANPPHTVLSFGTAFAVSPSGLLLTAKHVVSDGTAFFKGPMLGISNMGEGRLFIPITGPDLAIDTGAKETKPFALDLAALRPQDPLSAPANFLPLRKDLLEIGEEIIAAGYAKDITAPLFINERIDMRTLEGMDMAKTLRTNYSLRQLFFKKTMIGARWNIRLNHFPERGVTTEIGQYIYGTDLVEGASGGPVVDMEARVAAVISRKGTTELSGYELSTTTGTGLNVLPSGSGTAFSHHIVTSMFSAADRHYQ